MAKILKPLLISVAIAIMIFGCQSRPKVTEPYHDSSHARSSILAQGTVDSAIFTIYVDANNGQTVNLHRITSDWTENAVTWNNFAGAFDPDTITSFVADANGYHSIYITSLVIGWIGGDFPNDGLLLEQGLTPVTDYASSETTQVELRPMLKIFLTTTSGPEVVTIQRGTSGEVADAYIRQQLPDDNFGDATVLVTGAVNDSLKQTLIKFELDIQPPPELGALGDFVWEDVNMNGIQDQ